MAVERGYPSLNCLQYACWREENEDLIDAVERVDKEHSHSDELEDMKRDKENF